MSTHFPRSTRHRDGRHVTLCGLVYQPGSEAELTLSETPDCVICVARAGGFTIAESIRAASARAEVDR